MNILKQISNKIEKLKSHPEDVDIDFIVSLLSEAYSVAMDGLNRSNKAEKYNVLETQYNDTSSELSTIKLKLSTLKKESLINKDFVDCLKPLYEKLNNQMIGKIKLIESYSIEYKESIIKLLNNNDPLKFIELYDKVMQDFNNEWKKKPVKITNNDINNDKSNFVNYEHIKI